MFFRKKGKLRQKENDLLLKYLEIVKNRVKQQEALINNSVDHHNEVLYRAKLEKAKYLFLLKEARYRKAQLRDAVPNGR
ncbi:Protein of unknown function [Evansella caseinilytica]|uniref:DUF2508 family protein n=1 Tax=Evansella caseinilytica TaxID=1503961 RepID=A0A1H3UXI8_9BACI|nr:YaaL family protein [Evansella caseinilytica]SDZ67048.1 Protein of unknown function [Evansella caseinilytica]